jgi:hypothetical protein
MPEPDLHNDLDALARYAQQTVRLSSGAEIRAKAQRRRRRRHAVGSALGILFLGATGTGFALLQPSKTVTPTPPATAPPAVPTPPSTPTTRPTTSSTTPESSPESSDAAKPQLFIGKRKYTIVRVQSFESGLSLTNNGLAELDDDSGRQLFVPTPLGNNKYQIKAYHSETNAPTCWQLHNPRTTASLTIRSATCNDNKRNQQFIITKISSKTYSISDTDAAAFLQYSPNSGYIMEELGDAPLKTTFRFNDNGPAPASAP